MAAPCPLTPQGSVEALHRVAEEVLAAAATAEPSAGRAAPVSALTALGQATSAAIHASLSLAHTVYAPPLCLCLPCTVV